MLKTFQYSGIVSMVEHRLGKAEVAVRFCFLDLTFECRICTGVMWRRQHTESVISEIQVLNPECGLNSRLGSMVD